MKGSHASLLASILCVPAARLFAQAPYTPLPPEPASSNFPWIVAVVGIVISVIGYFLYQSFKRKSADVPASRSEAPQRQPARLSSASHYPAGSVFISYRRDDSADITGRIHERLVQRFAQDVVFKDVDSIPLGIDFRRHLEGALGQCRVLLAVIGDQWIERNSSVGQRRIDDPRDQLRIELEIALSRNIPVIPILVRKASVPSEEELPASLKSLAYRNGIQIRPDPDFTGDMERLIKGIEPYLRQ